MCFTIPYPADYGGVFDLYYKILALHKAGIRVHLHCFTKEIIPHPLKDYCEEVFYYKRRTGITSISLSLPYIVKSRLSSELLIRLRRDNYPILVEGVHSSGFLLDKAFDHRKIALRLHNVEHIYYSRLSTSTRSFLKKIYYQIESTLLKKYERIISQKVKIIFSVSQNDSIVYRSLFNVNNIQLLPVFIEFPFISIPGRGCYCLYHGNLSVAENEKVVLWLLRNVFSYLQVPFIVAGKKPSLFLKRFMSKYKNSTLIANPTDAVLNDLITKAQCHVLPSLNSTGIKLKLVHALFTGRHCIVNDAAVSGTGLETLCIIAGDAVEFREKVNELFQQEFTSEEASRRKKLLQQIFDSTKQTNQLIQWLS